MHGLIEAKRRKPQGAINDPPRGTGRHVDTPAAPPQRSLLPSRQPLRRMRVRAEKRAADAARSAGQGRLRPSSADVTQCPRDIADTPAPPRRRVSHTPSLTSILCSAP